MKSKRTVKRYLTQFNISLDEELLYDTFTPIEWYDLVMEGKVSQIPDSISKSSENWIEIFRYVVLDKYNFKKKEEILKVDREFLVKNKLTTIRIKIDLKMYEILNTCFPEYDIKPWELAMTGKDYFKKDENKILAVDWFLKKHSYTVEDILNSEESLNDMLIADGLTCLKHTHFKGFSELFEWYFKQKNIPFSVHDMKTKPMNYWSNIDNLKTQINRYINSLVNNGLINNPQNDIPYYFSNSIIKETEFSRILGANDRHRHTINILELVSEMYPQYDINPSHGQIIGVDGTTRLGSFEEKKIFDFIYLNLNIKEIEATGFKKRSEFFNKETKEHYCPDFIIENLSDKPIIIEYFGWYVPENKNKHAMFLNYIDKTHRKNDYFRKREDIYYIDLYPTDLKNMIGIEDRISEVIGTRGGEITQ